MGSKACFKRQPAGIQTGSSSTKCPRGGKPGARSPWSGSRQTATPGSSPAASPRALHGPRGPPCPMPPAARGPGAASLNHYGEALRRRPSRDYRLAGRSPVQVPASAAARTTRRPGCPESRAWGDRGRLSPTPAQVPARPASPAQTGSDILAEHRNGV